MEQITTLYVHTFNCKDIKPLNIQAVDVKKSKSGKRYTTVDEHYSLMNRMIIDTKNLNRVRFEFDVYFMVSENTDIKGFKEKILAHINDKKDRVIDELLALSNKKEKVKSAFKEEYEI